MPVVINPLETVQHFIAESLTSNSERSSLHELSDDDVLRTMQGMEYSVAYWSVCPCTVLRLFMELQTFYL